MTDSSNHLALGRCLDESTPDHELQFDLHAADPYTSSPVTRGTAAVIPNFSQAFLGQEAFDDQQFYVGHKGSEKCASAYPGEELVTAQAEPQRAALFSRTDKPVSRAAADAMSHGSAAKVVCLPALHRLAPIGVAHTLCVDVANCLAAQLESQLVHVEKMAADSITEGNPGAELCMQVVSFEHGSRVVFRVAVVLDMMADAALAAPSVECTRVSGDGFAFVTTFAAICGLLQDTYQATPTNAPPTALLNQRSLPLPVPAMTAEEVNSTLAIAMDLLGSTSVETKAEGANVLLSLVEKELEHSLQQQVMSMVLEEVHRLVQALDSGVEGLVIPVALLVSSVAPVMAMSPTLTTEAPTAAPEAIVDGLLNVVATNAQTAAGTAAAWTIARRTSSRAVHALAHAGMLHQSTFATVESALRTDQSIGGDSWVQHHLEGALCSTFSLSADAFAVCDAY